MSHFFYSYNGNKRNEINELFENIDFTNIKNIIEPFCGTSAYSFNLWLKYGDKFNYYLNDNSKILIDTYHLFMNESLNTINQELMKIKEHVSNKDEYEAYLKTGAETIYKHLFYHKYCNFRHSYYPRNNKFNLIKLTKKKLKFLEFIKSPNVFITNNDWNIIFNQFKDDENSILIFDPPYYKCDKRLYQNETFSVFDYILDNKDVVFKSHMYFILEDIQKIRPIFEHFSIYNEYNKHYTFNHKDTKHIIYYNKVKL